MPKKMAAAQLNNFRYAKIRIRTVLAVFPFFAAWLNAPKCFDQSTTQPMPQSRLGPLEYRGLIDTSPDTDLITGLKVP